MSETGEPPPASALAINLAVIRAILLRDINVLVGPNGVGLLVLLLMPLGHLLVITVIYKVLGRLAPVGMDDTVYYGISILPFVMFVYPSRQIMIAIISNKSLLYFSRVKTFDILYARVTLEIVTAIVVFVVVMLALLIFSRGFSPRDPSGFIFAIGATIYLACSIGIMNALLAQVLPIWFMIFNLCAPILWMISGIIFFPPALPDQYSYWLGFNPLLHCVEWIRYAYYEDYPEKCLDIPYIFSFATVCLLGSLIGERLSRAALR
ncbi:ABC transporter permease [Methylocella silvestris]|uniref:ABC-2 type transporter transmembrane domain-containing protein n=1 Tax=Methylocella silvestris TaxID=199596 RepID=A0A2J7TE34_METSI|nr:ABC transporter permease [Methylocella silvestris]PNG25032.1 hypothetical protein CR492_15385 [Methylocella silvestris]